MKYVYFIGIGGIGMSAIARYWKFKGYQVAGYDRTPSELTARLESEGIPVHYEDCPDMLPPDKENTLVIYTPAVPESLGELRKAKEEGYLLVKRSRALGEITRGQHCLAVAGTHGKTTTSTMLAHIITRHGGGCSAFLGGISRNYGTNMLLSDSSTVVAEADEFDRSFHQLHPEIAVITSVDPDHLDIYGDYGHVVEAFKVFASQVSGTLIAKKGTPLSQEDTPARFYTYHYTDTGADFYAASQHADELGRIHYDLHYPGGVIRDFYAGTPGWINAENGLAAAAAAISFGVEPENVREAISTFEGVKRRMEVHYNVPGTVFIDDYAHHPAELGSTISALREIYPGRRITGIFQPHLYTRTRDFADEFAKVLSTLDKLILLDIYPAREEPIPGVSSQMILDKVTAAEKVLVKKEELLDYLSREPLDVLVSFGAGDIDRLVEPIAQMLKDRQ